MSKNMRKNDQKRGVYQIIIPFKLVDWFELMF